MNFKIQNHSVVDHYLFELSNHLSYVSMRSIIILLCLDTNIII